MSRSGGCNSCLPNECWLAGRAQDIITNFQSGEINSATARSKLSLALQAASGRGCRKIASQQTEVLSVVAPGRLHTGISISPREPYQPYILGIVERQAPWDR